MKCAWIQAQSGTLINHMVLDSGLIYELGVTFYQNCLVHMKSSYPASTNDLTIFQFEDGDAKKSYLRLTDIQVTG